MINYDLLFLVLFYIILLIIFRIYRNKFEVQWKIFALYKTKIGLKLMDKIAKKFPNLLIILGYFGTFIGFLGMIFTFAFIVHSAYKLLFIPKAEAVLAPLLPGIVVSDKLPILSFWHWILAILIVAIVHEFSHGIYARLKNIKIKSSGFAFFGPILAAFVEPDEKELKKKRIRDQLFVFSAGPFSNIILGIVIFLILIFIFIPVTTNMIEINGLIVENVNEDLPVAESGLLPGHIITEVDNISINSEETLSDILNKKNPGNTISVLANQSYYEINLSSHPENSSKAFIGITFSKYNTQLKERFKSFSWVYSVLIWFNMLLFWTFNISVGVGLFNLLPLGPVDGGRMFYAAMFKITKNESKSMRILTIVSLFVLFLIIINLSPFLIKLIKFIISPFS